MKKARFTRLVVWILMATSHLTLTAGESSSTSTIDIKVMTFNIRNGKANDGENRWELRKEFVGEVIKKYSPDVLGLQEAYRFQLDVLNKSLPEYGEVGIGRDGASNGEHCSILYLKERFEMKASGTFWLSDTPSKPSTHWGNRYKRICTWVRLVDKKSKFPFYIYNTHLDHQSQRARANGMELIIKRIHERTHRDPFVLMGDLNAAEDNPVIAYLKGNKKLSSKSPIPLVDSWRVVHPKEQSVCTVSRFNGFMDGPKIDYIFVTPDTKVSSAAIDRTSKNGRNPSDHYPVTASLRLARDLSGTSRSDDKK